jgi:predicted nucleic acid-binding protein
VLARRRKARRGDALVAQSCIDHGIPLITRGRDFRSFAEAANLNVVLGLGPADLEHVRQTYEDLF